MKHIDLHVHTTASDGTLTPSEAVCHAKELGLSAVAVTDHDTFEGVHEALDAGARIGMEVIPGIEVSVDYQGLGVHVLGYFIDPDSAAMEKLLGWVIDERKRRNRLKTSQLSPVGITYRCNIHRCKTGHPSLNASCKNNQTRTRTHHRKTA